MEQQAPPTDNLYKFLAIAGVLAVVWPTQFYFNKLVELSIEIKQTQGRIELLQLSNDEINKEDRIIDKGLGELEKEIANFKKDFVASQGRPSDKFRQTLEGMDRKRRALDERRLRKSERLAGIKRDAYARRAEIYVLEEKTRALIAYAAIAILCLALGLSMAYFGFSRWYWLYQRPADIKAREEIEMLLARGQRAHVAEGHPQKRPWLHRLRQRLRKLLLFR
jgi:hypothetical protein